MPTYYLDSSALAKRYLREPGSQWLVDLMGSSSSNGFISTELVMVEVVAALCRAHREGRISASRRDRTAARFLDEYPGLVETLPVSPRVLGLASRLALRRALRAYDAVHLATSLDVVPDLIQTDLSAPIFVSADANLLEVARTEGLAVENPSDHP